MTPVRATYRVQLHPGFTFDDTVAILDHLSRLGASHVYTSPVLEAVAGSTHGYDVTDHGVVRAELGGDEGLARLVDELRARDMGWVVDIVPNHMSVAVPAQNPRWWDVLRHGPDATGARFFDIDWAAGDGRVVLPVLGASLDEELASGAIEIRLRDDSLVVGYHELEVPVAPATATLDDVGVGGDRLRTILAAQHHRLSWWRAGERNYRVFFDIDSLAALRIEDDDVFDAVHARLAEWIDADMVDGVRVDHVDGLADPAGYLDRLRGLVGPRRPLWVEKIVMVGETLPDAWPVSGTTGYEFARLTTAVAVDPDARPGLDAEWSARSGDDRGYHDVEHDAKRQAVEQRLTPELDRLVSLVAATGDGVAGDAGPGGAGPADAAPADAGRDGSGVRDALVELVVAFPTYRSYGRGTAPLDATDTHLLDRAAAVARARRPERRDVVDRLHQMLAAPDSAAAGDVRTRFQQLTSPAMAKGAEDTAFYRYHRFVALNEVGGDPGCFGADVEAFHQHCQLTQARHPDAMLAASTHDTKRSADVRARLAVLSHDVDGWRAALARWSAEADAFRPIRLDGATEYLGWQTMVGAWPLSGERLGEYLVKASREAKVHTSWTDPDDGYEDALRSFARSATTAPGLVADLDAFVASIAPAGRAVRLGEVVLRLTGPGVPDTYQGDHDWDLSLVDPDNRRPVDHDALDGRLRAAIDVGDVDRCGLEEGSLAKLWVTQRLLALRRDRPDRFVGGYSPIVASAGVVAFRRGSLVVVVDTRPDRPAPTRIALPEGRWVDVLRHDPPPVQDAVTTDALWQAVPITVLVPAGPSR